MEWVNTIIQGILLGGLYTLYGIGLSLIFGVMRMVNLAHGDFIIVAAYLSMVVISATTLHPLLSLLIVIPVMFTAGVLLQLGVLNPTLGKGIMPRLLITFGLSVVIQNVLQLQFSPDSQGLDAGALETKSIYINRQVSIGIMPLLTLVTAVAILAGLQLFLTRTQIGRAFRATSDDPATAELMGINSRLIYGLAFGISMAIVAVAGVVMGIRTNFAPNDGPARLIFAYETVIIGGLGSLWGTLAGGLTLGLAQTIGARLDTRWFQLAGHIVTLFILLIRPTGLFARTRDE